MQHVGSMRRIYILMVRPQPQGADMAAAVAIEAIITRRDQTRSKRESLENLGTVL